jgi:hypothetical protein
MSATLNPSPESSSRSPPSITRTTGNGCDKPPYPRLIFDAQTRILLKPYVFNSGTVPDGASIIQKVGIADAATFGGLYTQLAPPYFTNAIGSQSGTIRKNPTWSASSNLTWLVGSHNAKVGVLYTNVQRLQQNLSQQFSFGVGPTLSPGTNSTGNVSASAVLALPSSYTAKCTKYDQDDFSFGMWSGFIEDEWKINASRTMTHGIRYD